MERGKRRQGKEKETNEIKKGYGRRGRYSGRKGTGWRAKEGEVRKEDEREGMEWKGRKGERLKAILGEGIGREGTGRESYQGNVGSERE